MMSLRQHERVQYAIEPADTRAWWVTPTIVSRDGARRSLPRFRVLGIDDVEARLAADGFLHRNQHWH